MSASGGYDIFFDHDRAHVVRAAPQSNLAETQPLRQPRRLNVIDVVHVETRDGQHLEVIHSRRFGFDLAAERGVLSLKCPGNKGKESARFILKIANALQMPHAMLDSIA